MHVSTMPTPESLRTERMEGEHFKTGPYSQYPAGDPLHIVIGTVESTKLNYPSMHKTGNFCDVKNS